METPSAGEKVIATCPLGSDTREEKLWLTEEYIQLLYRGQLKVFNLTDVRRLSFNHRKLMLPLIAGGITATLSLVAVFKLNYNPWLTLSLLVAGCMATFIGYRGSWVLTIQEDRFHSDFYLKGISPALRSFIQYAGTFIGHQPKGILYLTFSHEERRSFRNDYVVLAAEKRLYFREEISHISASALSVVPVNSLAPTVHISWKTDPQTGNILPFLLKGSRINLQEYPPVYQPQ